MDGKTPTRRNPPRAASVASRASTPGPTEVTRTVTTTSFQAERATSNSRARTGSRPSVATGGSQAYGAAGKTGMAGNMSVSNELNTFTQAFSTQRDEIAKVTRSSQSSTRPVASTQPVIGNSARSKVPLISTVAEEADEPEESPLASPSIPFRRGANMATSAGRTFTYNQPPFPRDQSSFTHDRPPSRSYATGHEGGMAEGYWPDNFTPRPAPTPSVYQIYRRTVDRSWFYSFLEKFLISVCVLFAGVWVLFFLRMSVWPRLPESGRGYIKSILPQRSPNTVSLDPSNTTSGGYVVATATRPEWVWATGYKLSRDFAMQGEHRLLLAEENVRRLSKSDELRSASIQRLEAELPTMLVVRRNNETGELEIPDQFWQALLSRIEQLGDKTTAKASELTDWDQYLEGNKAMIDELLNQKMDRQVKPVIKEVLAELYVVNKDDFIDTVNLQAEKFDVELDHLKHLLETTYKFSEGEVARIASQTADLVVTKRLDTLGGQELDMIAHANLVYNQDIAIKRVDHFCAGLGARVDPHLTSPTQTRSLNLFQRVYRSLVWLPSPHPPIAALEPWREAPDCWCAAATPGDEGKAQLAVIMPHSIFPEQVTVEHIPAGGTLDIASAPRHMELWVEIKDKAKREDYDAVRELVGMMNGGCAPQSTMGPDYVCLGRWEYRIDAPNHVQTFSLDIKLKHIGLAVQKAVVRVDTNWGQEWTCIYRVRMHGEVEKPVFERTEKRREEFRVV